MLCLVLLSSMHAAAQESAADASAPSGDGTDTMAQSTAREQDLTDQQARAHFSVGRAMYDAGRFAEAANEFQQAYDLSHRAQLLYNLYIAYRDSSQLVRARDALRRYLAEVSEIPNRLHLVSRLEALETQIAEEERVRAESEAELAAAEQAAADAEAARERAEQDAHIARNRQRPWWPWLLVGVGAAAIGTGIGVGVDAGQQADALRALCTTPNPVAGQPPIHTCQGDPNVAGADEPLTRRSSILAQAAVSDALWIGGATLAAAGLVLAFALDDDVPPREANEPSVSAGCGPTGCAASVAVSF